MYESSRTSGIIQRTPKTLSLPVSVSKKEHGPRAALEQENVEEEEVNHQKSFVPWPPRVLEDGSEVTPHFSVMVWWNEILEPMR